MVDLQHIFFARIRAIDLECPQCADVFQVTHSSGPPRAYEYTTGRFRCPTCHLVLQLGVLAWPVARQTGRAWPIAPDWRVTPRIALALRRRSPGFWQSRSLERREPANRVLNEPVSDPVRNKDPEE